MSWTSRRSRCDRRLVGTSRLSRILARINANTPDSLPPPFLLLAVAIAITGTPAVGTDSRPVDVLPAIVKAEVCPGKGQHCWPLSMSEELHRDPTGTAAASLPPNSTSNIYLHVPANATLRVDFA